MKNNPDCEELSGALMHRVDVVVHVALRLLARAIVEPPDDWRDWVESDQLDAALLHASRDGYPIKEVGSARDLVDAAMYEREERLAELMVLHADREAMDWTEQ